MNARRLIDYLAHGRLTPSHGRISMADAVALGWAERSSLVVRDAFAIDQDDAVEGDLKKHDKKYHPDGYEAGDTCQLRDRLDRGNAPDLLSPTGATGGPIPVRITKEDSPGRVREKVCQILSDQNNNMHLTDQVSDGCSGHSDERVMLYSERFGKDPVTIAKMPKQWMDKFSGSARSDGGVMTSGGYIIEHMFEHGHAKEDEIEFLTNLQKTLDDPETVKHCTVAPDGSRRDTLIFTGWNADTKTGYAAMIGLSGDGSLRLLTLMKGHKKKPHKFGQGEIVFAKPQWKQ